MCIRDSLKRAGIGKRASRSPLGPPPRQFVPGHDTVPQPTLMRRAIAELVGTYVLVLLGTLSVVTMIVFFKGPDMAGLLLIGLAFGVAVMVMIYAFGHISGTHINPAVSIALWATGRLPAKDLVGYIVAQLIGAVLASFRPGRRRRRAGRR